LILRFIFYSIASVDGNTLKIVDLVSAETISDGSVDRRVVEIKGDTVYICTDGEWRSAREQHREPICVGFNKRYIRPVMADLTLPVT
jgi:hypothetical protein